MRQGGRVTKRIIGSLAMRELLDSILHFYNSSWITGSIDFEQSQVHPTNFKAIASTLPTGLATTWSRTCPLRSNPARQHNPYSHACLAQRHPHLQCTLPVPFTDIETAFLVHFNCWEASLDSLPFGPLPQLLWIKCFPQYRRARQEHEPPTRSCHLPHGPAGINTWGYAWVHGRTWRHLNCQPTVHSWPRFIFHTQSGHLLWSHYTFRWPLW